MNRYKVTRDGVTVATFPDGSGAWRWLARQIGYSVYHAVTHEGWDIIHPDGASLAASYGGRG